MDKDNKFIVAIVVAVIAALALVITTSLIASNISKVKLETATTGFNVGAAAGETFDTAKVSQIGMNYATTTIGSLYNNSGRTRVIKRVYAYSDKWITNQSATASTSLQAATSTSNSGIGSNTNYVLDASGASAVSTGTSFQTLTTTLSITDAYRLWPTGSYLNFITATTMTSTVLGVVGVEYYNY